MEKSKPVQAVPKTEDEATDLKDIQYRINEFGEIVRDIKTEDIKVFLDENVPDKKFKEEGS